ncbi:DNA polymerase III subunit chi, partial [Pseudomonas aeruginosa]|nr:DNA polymerase III subunit chi [Pseudomonas aeruginosa]
MTRVDFYVIPSADPSARLQVAGRRGGKGGRPGLRVDRHFAAAAPRREVVGRRW